jgi:signal transduction histidine kinase
MSALTRPPIESLRPVVSFAVARLLFACAALVGVAIAGFPFEGTLATALLVTAIPWSAANLWIARRDPAASLHPVVPAGDLAMLAAIQYAVPDTYGAVHFLALVFVGVHAHFQGLRRGVIIAAIGSAGIVIVSIVRDGPLENSELAYYEPVFAAAALAGAAIIGELRGAETAGRLRARALTRRALAEEDEVRRQVALFIHDGPVQELLGLDLLLSGALSAAKRGDTDRAMSLMEDSRELAESNIRALRDEIVGLGPYAFDELSFEIALERNIPVWLRRYGCEVTIDADVELEPAVAGDLFRIAQEAVVNACKHGEAPHVHVEVTRSDAYVDLTITDDGGGFGDVDPLDANRPGHIGIAGIRERAELLGGTLDIQSSPGETVLHVRVPMGGIRRRVRRAD